MYESIPDAKLIYVVRDPIPRIISHWHHGIVKGRFSTDPESTFDDLENNNLVLTSQYNIQLKEFLKFYPLERILILSAEDLKNNREETLRCTFEFLDVDHTFQNESFKELFHVSADKKVEGEGKSINIEKPLLGEEWINIIKVHLEPHIQEFRMLTGKKLESWKV
jgi:hypothetical protein